MSMETFDFERMCIFKNVIYAIYINCHRIHKSYINKYLLITLETNDVVRNMLISNLLPRCYRLIG